MPSLKDYVEHHKVSNFPTVDVETYVQGKGIEYTKSGKWLKMRCILPFGHDDTSPSFFIHSEHGGYNCYVCGSGNWDELCKHMNWNINIDTLDVESIPDAIWKDSAKRIKQLESPEKREKSFHKPHGMRKIDGITSHCHNHMKYLQNRRLANAIDTFEISYTIQSDVEYETNYLNRVIIPCHNSEGKYIWPEGRLITPAKTDRKYYRPFGVEKIKYLFNLHRVLQQGYQDVIVVEGIMDAINLWMWNFPAVCCYGAGLDEQQIAQLMVFDNVMLCLDNDTAGNKGYAVAVNKLLNTGINLFRIMLPKGQDVNNIDLAKWNRLYKIRKHITHYIKIKKSTD